MFELSRGGHIIYNQSWFFKMFLFYVLKNGRIKESFKTTNKINGNDIFSNVRNSVNDLL